MTTSKLYWTRSPVEFHTEGELKSSPYTEDAGIDMVTVATAVVYPGEFARLELGIRIALPGGTCATIIGRSSMVSQGLLVLPGLIDSGYRGPLYAFVQNLSEEKMVLRSGFRHVQLLIFKNVLEEIGKPEYVEELPPGYRGNNGFGSTGS